VNRRWRLGARCWIFYRGERGGRREFLDADSFDWFDKLSAGKFGTGKTQKPRQRKTAAGGQNACGG